MSVTYRTPKSVHSAYVARIVGRDPATEYARVFEPARDVTQAPTNKTRVYEWVLDDGIYEIQLEVCKGRPYRIWIRVAEDQIHPSHELEALNLFPPVDDSDPAATKRLVNLGIVAGNR